MGEAEGTVMLQPIKPGKSGAQKKLDKIEYMTKTCLLPGASGSSTNFLVKANSLTECHAISMSMGCVYCKTSLDETLLSYVTIYGGDNVTFCTTKRSEYVTSP